jgi:predicted nuclease of predicted toxin-antitoxin system
MLASREDRVIVSGDSDFSAIPVDCFRSSVGAVV